MELRDFGDTQAPFRSVTPEPNRPRPKADVCPLMADRLEAGGAQTEISYWL